MLQCRSLVDPEHSQLATCFPLVVLCFSIPACSEAPFSFFEFKISCPPASVLIPGYGWNEQIHCKSLDAPLDLNLVSLTESKIWNSHITIILLLYQCLTKHFSPPARIEIFICVRCLVWTHENSASAFLVNWYARLFPSVIGFPERVLETRLRWAGRRRWLQGLGRWQWFYHLAALILQLQSDCYWIQGQLY